MNLQCEAQLSLDDSSGNFEGGTYSISGYQEAVCSEVGEFAYASLIASVGARVSYTAYTNVGDVNAGWVYTYNPSTCNCACRAGNDIVRATNYQHWVISYESLVMGERISATSER